MHPEARGQLEDEWRALHSSAETFALISPGSYSTLVASRWSPNSLFWPIDLAVIPGPLRLSSVTREKYSRLAVAMVRVLVGGGDHGHRSSGPPRSGGIGIGAMLACNDGTILMRAGMKQS